MNSNKVKYSFDTVPAFSISKSSFAESVFCGSDIYLYFNHGINEELFDPSMIKIEPSIPVFRVQVKNTYIILTLDSLVNELLDCTIFISHAITDIYFQQLEFDSQWYRKYFLFFKKNLFLKLKQIEKGNLNFIPKHFLVILKQRVHKFKFMILSF